jgi:hypothetical protein
MRQSAGKEETDRRSERVHLMIRIPTFARYKKGSLSLLNLGFVEALPPYAISQDSRCATSSA